MEMASPWNRHCADCIGTLSFPMLARVLAVAWCPSVRVRLANTSRSSIETAERIGLVIAWSFLPPIFQHCVIRKFGYLQKIRALLC